MPLRVLSVVGARPNFMKLAPLAHELARRGVPHTIVHTGQHYDVDMSDNVLQSLAIAPPDFNLAVGSGSHAHQTAAIMQRFEPICLEGKPDIVLVYGDVNSTIAAALVAAKLGIQVGHVEAGLRSHDWTMPEEINRVLTDRLSDVLFTPSRDAVDNLRAEGISPARVHFVGNIMIDSLLTLLPRVREAHSDGIGAPYIVVTLHRPANVDDPTRLQELLKALVELSRERHIVFPVHPRTRARMRDLGWQPESHGNGNGGERGTGLRLLDPIPYDRMLGLVLGSDLVITDSGGLQEETSFLGVSCLTVRPNTERPITCLEGTNRLVAPTYEAVLQAAREVRRPATAPKIERWDGRTAWRIAEVLCEDARFD